MNCQEFESTLNEVLDDRKDPSEDLNLTDHSDQCDDCKELIGLYSSIAGYSHTVDTLGDHSSKLRWKSAYVLAATAAAVLLLLSPIGLWNKAPEVVNVAQLDSKDRALSVDNFESTKSKTDPSFWVDRPLAKIVRIEKFPFSVQRLTS